ncbi:MAG: acyltransferase [Xanthobacteraceae bacterium]|nr:acyltransferase [Xanthobacteraceae bacterium]
MSGSSLALSNLRAFVILIVLAFHSFLAYLGSLPDAPFPFDIAPFRWNAFPIVDSQRWFGFDIFCAFQDVYLMSFMFFLSGLFVWPSLKRKGCAVFLSDRFLRIGVPFAGAVLVLAPIALYPAYLVTATDPSVSAFWQHWLALPFWPSGPAWFLWQLLALNIVATAIFGLAPSWGERLARISADAAKRPMRYFAGLVTLSAIAYIPLALAFTPWSWKTFGVFSFQLCRPLQYLVYFFAGVGIGAHGLENGLLGVSGPLARRWAAWLSAFLAAFVLWAGPIALMPDRDNGPLGLQTLSDFGYVLACACGCFFVAGVSLRFASWRSSWLDSLSRSAYGMYLIHYVFVVWLQYALLEAALSAIIKASIVLTLTVVASWGTMILVGRLRLGASLKGATSPRIALDPVQSGAAVSAGGENKAAAPTRVAD